LTGSVREEIINITVVVRSQLFRPGAQEEICTQWYHKVIYAISVALLVDIRNDPVRHNLHILFPIITVLLGAVLVVSPLSVDQEDDKVEKVKVGDGGVEAGREGPGEGHDPVAEVVGVPAPAPPAAGDEPGPLLRLHRLQAGLPAVPEIVLLAVGGAEDVVAEHVEGEDDGGQDGAELDLLVDEVAGLEGVGEGDPGEVADGEHETEAVGGDVHGGEDGGLG
jgi:hypothetical protein